jgi:hypothetical protein
MTIDRSMIVNLIDLDNRKYVRIRLDRTIIASNQLSDKIVVVFLHPSCFRMLIPVLPGLDQKQLEDLLPKILKQTPNVVKEAFKRILSPYRTGGSGKLFFYAVM